jgi:hypothetical protein
MRDLRQGTCRGEFATETAKVNKRSNLLRINLPLMLFRHLFTPSSPNDYLYLWMTERRAYGDNEEGPDTQ